MSNTLPEKILRCGSSDGKVGPIDRVTYAPVGKREGAVHVYKFPMPGLGSFTDGEQERSPLNTATCVSSMGTTY